MTTPKTAKKAVKPTRFIAVAESSYGVSFVSEPSHDAGVALKEVARQIESEEDDESVTQSEYFVYEVVSVKQFEAETAGIRFVPTPPER